MLIASGWLGCAAHHVPADDGGTRDADAKGDGADDGAIVEPDPLSGVVQIAAGGQGTCALVEGGEAYCWGLDAIGDLDDGENPPARCDVSGRWYPCALTPDHVRGFSGPLAYIATDGGHTCAIDEALSTYCWGNDHYEQIGDGCGSQDVCTVWSDDGCASTPAELTLQGPPVTIAPGAHHTCVLLSGGTVWCWGDDELGQVGNGDEAFEPEQTCPERPSIAAIPVEVTGLGGPATQVVAGSYISCALLESGSVNCWGGGNWGEQGAHAWCDVGELLPWHCEPSPVLMTEFSAPVVEVAVGQWFICALVDDGTVECTGYGGYGELGDGSGASMGGKSTEVDLSAPAKEITAGFNHGCALLEGGAVECWGDNRFGQLGHGQPDRWEEFSPVSVVGLSRPAVSVRAGAQHTCALLDDGTIQCWGYNLFGQLGNDDPERRTTYVPVRVVAPR